jgi:uncharacterized membrane protein YdjX (TVP38/TMEM64 family)
MINFLQKNRKTIFNVSIILMIVLIVVISINIMPFVLSLRDEAKRDIFVNQIKSYGVGGVFIAILIQILQVIVAFIPSFPIEVAFGMVYGWVGGLIVAMTGMMIGTSIVFMLVKVCGKSLVNYIFSNEKISKLGFMHNERRRDLFIFILFFIPGTPRDLLTYIAPLTKINFVRFLVISTVARLPSMITSTFAGRSIGNGEWGLTIAVFVIIGALGITGILLNNMIHEKMNKHHKMVKENIDG